MTVFSKLNNTTDTTVARQRQVLPPISFERPTKKELQRGDYHTYKLRNNPAEDQSPVYELSVPYFRSGTCEEYLLFEKNLNRVTTGQGATSGPNKFLVARRLLEGDALTTFNNALPAGTTETNASFETCMKALKNSIFPHRAVLMQKRYLRRFVRKPATLKTREFVARLIEINSYLPEFPPTTTGGADPASLPDDELLDILEFGMPSSWQKQMVLQDFDPLQHTIKEFTEFCERMEQVEAHEGTKVTSSSSNKKSERSKSSGSKKRNREQVEQEVEKYCMLHGKGNHSTEDCRTLKAQAKRMKATYEAQTPENRQKLKNRQELHAIIAESVEEALKKKKFTPLKKKRKAEADLKQFEQLSISGTEESDSSSSEEE